MLHRIKFISNFYYFPQYIKVKVLPINNSLGFRSYTLFFSLLLTLFLSDFYARLPMYLNQIISKMNI